MSFNIYSSRWYNFMTRSWKYWDSTSRIMIAKYFRLIKHNWRCNHICLLSLYCYNSCISKFSLPILWLQVYHISHLCMLHQRSDCVPTNSGQQIFSFNMIFISSSWSMYFFITLSDKIGISSISSGTIAVVVGVVDNLLPKIFCRFKLWNWYFLPSSSDCVNSPHIAMPMSLAQSNKTVPRRLRVLPGDLIVFFLGRIFIHPIISNICKCSKI